ncbi:MAG: class I SAM-dependent methyltransferase [Proteobacteria bacterium]|nr:class I SAM-dependent methyltransferase [Pseudomonadota bacterium]MBU1741573.1 class I SAM-dependent methyltransferase [Pseudomonadota bacterium]
MLRLWPRRLDTIPGRRLTGPTFGGWEVLDLTRALAAAAPAGDLGRLWRDHAARGGALHGQYDRFDMIVLTGLIRLFGVQKVLECAPHQGWSTTLMQLVLPGEGEHRSFDRVDYEAAIQDAVRRHTTLKNWSFFVGDFQDLIGGHWDYLSQVDLLFIDADHGQAFAQWYLDEARLLDQVRPGCLIQIHDVYPPGREPARLGESRYAWPWLADKRDRFDVYFTWEMARLKEIQRILGKKVFLDHAGRQANNCSLWLYKR